MITPDNKKTVKDLEIFDDFVTGYSVQRLAEIYHTSDENLLNSIRRGAKFYSQFYDHFSFRSKAKPTVKEKELFFNFIKSSDNPELFQIYDSNPKQVESIIRRVSSYCLSRYNATQILRGFTILLLASLICAIISFFTISQFLPPPLKVISGQVICIIFLILIATFRVLRGYTVKTRFSHVKEAIIWTVLLWLIIGLILIIILYLLESSTLPLGFMETLSNILNVYSLAVEQLFPNIILFWIIQNAIFIVIWAKITSLAIHVQSNNEVEHYPPIILETNEGIRTFVGSRNIEFRKNKIHTWDYISALWIPLECIKKIARGKWDNEIDDYAETTIWEAGTQPYETSKKNVIEDSMKKPKKLEDVNNGLIRLLCEIRDRASKRNSANAILAGIDLITLEKQYQIAESTINDPQKRKQFCKEFKTLSETIDERGTYAIIHWRKLITNACRNVIDAYRENPSAQINIDTESKNRRKEYIVALIAAIGSIVVAFIGHI